MANTVKHKKSGLAGDIPALTDLDAGELLYNFADGIIYLKKISGGIETIVEFHGSETAHLLKMLPLQSNPANGYLKLYPKTDKALYIKLPSGEEYKLLSTGDRRSSVRASGSTDDSIVTETGIREAINAAVPTDIIPIYNVGSFNQFVDAYNAIRSKYTGGIIRCTGDIIMTSDLTVDLSGIRIEGDGCNWRFYNDVYLNPSTVRKLIITGGSPVFSGIRFWGTSGQSNIEMDKGTNRHCFDISPTNTGASMYITFDRCGFMDIVAGQTTGPIIRVTANMASNASVNISFNGCRIASHSAATGINYTGFKIYHSYSSTGSSTSINVTVSNQIPSTDYELYNTSTLFALTSYFSSTKLEFNSDETAWLDTQTMLYALTRTNNILNAPAYPIDTANDQILVSKHSDRKNVYRVPLSSFQGALTVKEGFLLGRITGAGDGAPQNIDIGAGLALDTKGVLSCTVNPQVTISLDKAIFSTSRLLSTANSWTDITANFNKTISLTPGTYYINAQVHFTRASSAQTFVGFRLTVAGIVIVAAENDFYRHVTLNASTYVTVASNTTITLQVYASVASAVSVVATTMAAPNPQAGPATMINVLKIG